MVHHRMNQTTFMILMRKSLRLIKRKNITMTIIRHHTIPAQL